MEIPRRPCSSCRAEGCPPGTWTDGCEVCDYEDRIQLPIAAPPPPQPSGRQLDYSRYLDEPYHSAGWFGVGEDPPSVGDITEDELHPDLGDK